MYLVAPLILSWEPTYSTCNYSVSEFPLLIFYRKEKWNPVVRSYNIDSACTPIFFYPIIAQQRVLLSFCYSVLLDFGHFMIILARTIHPYDMFAISAKKIEKENSNDNYFIQLIFNLVYCKICLLFRKRLTLKTVV